MARWRNISVSESEKLIADGNVMVLDMRDKRSYVFSHHPSAIHLDNLMLREILKTTDKNLPVLIYCYHGHSSQDMATLFTDFGFNQVYSLDGGYEALYLSMQPPKKALTQPVVNWLNDRGFNPDNLDARLKNNETALMQAAREGALWVCEELIDAGASVNLKNADGNNALWMACLRNEREVVKVLLTAGVDIDNQNDNGATVLIQTASKGNCDLLNLLLNQGANPNLTTLDGFSPLDVAENIATLKTLKGFMNNLQAGIPSAVNA